MRSSVFAMSGEWFDNGLIVRHSANETISAKVSQSYGKAGSGFGPPDFGKGRSAPASFLPGAFRALRRRRGGRSRQTSRTSGCTGGGLRYSVRFVTAGGKTQAQATTGVDRASHRSFLLRRSGVRQARSGSRCAGTTVSRPYSRKAVSRGSARPSRRRSRDSRPLFSTGRNVSTVAHG